MIMHWSTIYTHTIGIIRIQLFVQLHESGNLESESITLIISFFIFYLGCMIYIISHFMFEYLINSDIGFISFIIIYPNFCSIGITL